MVRTADPAELTAFRGINPDVGKPESDYFLLDRFEAVFFEAVFLTAAFFPAGFRAADFFPAGFAPALFDPPKIVSQPAENASVEPVCTVYPVIVDLYSAKRNRRLVPRKTYRVEPLETIRRDPRSSLWPGIRQAISDWTDGT